MARSPRLLLVELAVAGRFHRGVLFPFLAGWARARAVDTRWVRFGVPVTAGGAGASLEAADVARLGDLIDEHRPSHLLFSHTPDGALAAALRRALEGTRVLRVPAAPGDRGPRRVGGVRVEALAPDLSDVDRLLGLHEPAMRGAGLFEAAAPDFAFEPGNALARTIPALPFVICGHECTYGDAIDRSGLFRDLDLTGCVRKGGCTFCTRPESTAAFRADPLTLIERQLLAIDRTCPQAAGPRAIRMVGEPVLGAVDRVAEKIVALAIAPCQLLLDGRPDTLVDHRGRLERALVTLRGSGHRLEMSLIGIESFSGRELARLNKGVSPAQNLRAVQTLVELEAAHPETFGFRRHGGLSLITFTPWTTPAELDLTLTIAELLGIGDLCGKLLDGRLRLVEGLPLTLAARRDALLAERYDDPLLDTAARSFYAPELPWRFQHPSMGAVSRICVRLSREAPEDADGLLARVREVARTAREIAGLDEVSVAARIARAAARHGPAGEEVTPEALLASAARHGPAGEEVTPEALLASAARSVEGDALEGPPAERWERLDRSRGADGRRREGGLGLAVLLAHKPVVKREPVSAAEVGAWLRDPALPNVRARQRRSAPGRGEPVFEIFFGERAEDVARAVALGAALEDAASREAWIEAAVEVGTLLGYPRCCALAHAREPSAIRDQPAFLHVAHRLAVDGPVPWALCPVSDALVEHVPCGLTCAPTLARARRLLERLGDADPEGLARLVAMLERPQVLLLGRQGRSVELLPEEEPGPRFRYRAGACRGGGEDVRALAEGDALILEEELTLVLRRGRVHASLSGRAFLWWHRRAFQTELWRAITDCARALSQARPAAGGAHPSPAAEERPWMRPVVHLLGQLQARGVSFAGFRIGETRPTRDGRLLVGLASTDGEQLHLALVPREPGSRFLHAAGPLGVGYPADRPLETEPTRRAARVFARKLGHVLDRRPGGAAP